MNAKKDVRWRFWCHTNDGATEGTPENCKQLKALLNYSVLFLKPDDRFFLTDSDIIDDGRFRQLLRNDDNFRRFFRGVGCRDSCVHIAARADASGFPKTLLKWHYPETGLLATRASTRDRSSELPR